MILKEGEMAISEATQRRVMNTRVIISVPMEISPLTEVNIAGTSRLNTCINTPSASKGSAN
jgi:hypothetical protein